MPILSRGSRRALLWSGVVLFAIPGALRTYLLMPFPGSQPLHVFAFAYHLHWLVTPLRIAGAAMMIVPIFLTMRDGGWWRRAGIVVLLAVCGALWYASDVQMTAERMFHEPQTVIFAQGEDNRLGPQTIVLGVALNGVAKAYPVKFLAYHHKVHDSLGPQAILVTYCSVCRSGRVYVPVIDGRVQQFRLVGMRQYNAIIEDAETKSWWFQETGEAMAGPRAGMQLAEIPSEEMTLGAWTALHPSTLVMQPDPASAAGYAMFAKWDSVRPPRVYFDSSSYTWDPRAWIVGVTAGSHAKAYAWSGLVRATVVNDSLADVPIVLALEADTMSFHAWRRDLHGMVLRFTRDSAAAMRDTTGSLWNWAGACIGGPLHGQQLEPVLAYREAWHSWRTFHPATERWEAPQ